MIAKKVLDPTLNLNIVCTEDSHNNNNNNNCNTTLTNCKDN